MRLTFIIIGMLVVAYFLALGIRTYLKEQRQAKQNVNHGSEENTITNQTKD